MSSPRIAANLIVGDGWIEEEVQKLLTSLEPHIQGIYVAYNGKKKFPNWQSMTTTPIYMDKFKWVDDFAAARNFALSMIPKKEYDYWMWVDSDDFLVAPKGFDDLFSKMDPYTKGVFLRYAYAVEPVTGKVVVEQWRERIFDTDWEWQWKYPIHEVVTAPQQSQFIRYEGPVFIQHQRLSGEDRNTRARNRRIVSKALREEPDDPRFQYYMANELLSEATAEEDPIKRGLICDAGILAYEKYLKTIKSNVTDDTYMAAIRIGDLNALKGNNDAAIDAYLTASKLRPDWPEAFVSSARAAMELEDWYRCKAFANIAINMPKPITSAAVEPMMYDFLPVFLRGMANENLGNIEDAIKDYVKARKFWEPESGEITDKLKELRKKLREKKSGVQQTDWDLRKKYRGTRPEKSICFYTSPIPETWNYETLKEGGHGGAETLVLELAKRFAADGWRSVVFGVPGNARGIDNDTGVEFWNSDEWLPHEKFKVFISSRSPNPYGGSIEADMKFLWCHDVNIGPVMLQADPPVHTRPDKIVCLSEWHKKHFMKLYGLKDNRIAIVPNGFDIDLYPRKSSYADGHKFIYASSPDRGLDTLLALWPHIRKNWPDSTLNVYYGWEFIDKLIALGNTNLALFKNSIVNVIENLGGEEIGINWVGRRSPAELAQATMDCDIWAYPTEFMETFCLTAVQSQAAGVIPLASKLGALSETVAVKDLLIEGWSRNADYQNKFVNRLMLLMNGSEESRAELREKGRDLSEKFTIDNSYAAWNNLFKRM